MTNSKYLGLCLFGEKIACLVDQGKKENIETIREKANKKEVVRYLIQKYDIDFSSTNYDINAFENFFFDSLMESSKSGIFSNGLLTLLSTILSECEVKLNSLVQ